jgi:hypothetical protein
MMTPRPDRISPEGAKTATLVFPRGAANLRVRAGDARGSGGLATGSFSGPRPEITSAGSTVFDEQRLKGISGELRLQSDNGGPTPGLYQVTIRSGASRLSVGTTQQVVDSPSMSGTPE